MLSRPSGQRSVGGQSRELLVSCSVTDSTALMSVNARLSAEYVLFGCYRIEPKSFELTADGIRFNTKFKYRDVNYSFKSYIGLRFDEVRQLYHCLDKTLPVLAFRLTEEATERILSSIALTHPSASGLSATGLSTLFDRSSGQ